MHRQRLIVVLSVLLASLLLFQPAAGAAGQVNYKTGISGTVCLTIDDGYSRQAITQALSTLRAKGVHCTFFVIGSRLTATPDLWRQAVRDGHEICYHSMNHNILSSWNDQAILNDLRQWNKKAKSVLGESYSIPKFARLPGGGGHENKRIQALFNSMGYKLISWSADTYTGVIKRGSHNLNRRIADYIKKSTKANSIILIHFNSADVQAIPYYIDWLTSHYKVGRVSDAFQVLPIIPKLPKLPGTPNPKPPHT